MRRREAIGLLIGAAATWPLSGRAQQSEPMKRVGVLHIPNDLLATAGELIEQE